MDGNDFLQGYALIIALMCIGRAVQVKLRRRTRRTKENRATIPGTRRTISKQH